MSGLELHARLVPGSVDGWSLEVRLRGELTGPHTPTLEHFLDGLRDHIPVVVHVDLGDVSLIDASGVRVLIGAQRGFRNAGRSIVVVRAERAVAKVLELTALADELADG